MKIVTSYTFKASKGYGNGFLNWQKRHAVNATSLHFYILGDFITIKPIFDEKGDKLSD